MALLFAGCTDILDIEPNNKVVADKVLTTEEGIAMHMANLYGRLPIEDFSYAIDKGFNWGIGNKMCIRDSNDSFSYFMLDKV